MNASALNVIVNVTKIATSSLSVITIFIMTVVNFDIEIIIKASSGALFLYLNTREVCTMTDTIATCPNNNCKHHNGNDGCKLKKISLSTDLFCLSYQRRYEAEYKDMIRNSKPIDFKRCEKDVIN